MMRLLCLGALLLGCILSGDLLLQLGRCVVYTFLLLESAAYRSWVRYNWLYVLMCNESVIRHCLALEHSAYRSLVLQIAVPIV